MPALRIDVAVWRDEHGSTYEWPMSTKDNRKSRVLARINRWGINPPADNTLRIFHYDPASCAIRAYAEELRKEA